MTIRRLPIWVLFTLFLTLACHGFAAETYRDTVITQDTIWRERVSIDGVVMVAPQATLSIRPGTDVLFAGYSSVTARSALVVQGRIDASGTAEAPVRFAASSTHPWSGILLVDSGKNNRLEGVWIRGAAAPITAIRSSLTVVDSLVDGGGTGMELTDSTVAIRGGEVRNADGGISIDGGDVTVRGTLVSANGIGISARKGGLTCRECRISGNRRRGLFLFQSRFLIEDSLFEGNRIAAAFDGGEGVFRRNRVESSGGDGVHAANSRVVIVENLFSRNVGNALTLRDRQAVVSRNIFQGGEGFDIVNLGSIPLFLPGNWWEGGDPVARGRLGGVGPIDVRPIFPHRPPYP
ncbi:MAG: hypothetical protein Fur0034_20110 [Desulfuromonadia bacterium]